VNPLLLILLCPAAAVLLLFFVGPENKRLVRAIATVATGIALATALTLFFGFAGAPAGESVGSHVYKFTDKWVWVETLGLSFHVGVDGISVALVLLTAFTIFTGVMVSYRIQTRVKEYYISLLALVTGVFGVFVSLDMFFYYFFYELAVIPMFLLIGVWGSTTRTVDQRYATMKLVLVLSAGAALALVGLIAVYVQGWRELGHATFDLLELEKVQFTSAFQMIWFIPVFLGFASLVPMWPLHSWSPAGHAAAPAAVSMLHAGVLMKLGAYGIVRLVLPWFPEASHTYLPWVAGLCCMNILYGGYVAIHQRDMKLIIGYSSSSHMGYVLLGIASLTALGLEGAVFLMFAHGIMTALAFSLIGFFYDQTHTRMLDDLGGMMKAMPFIGTCFVIAAMASAGLPGFANFVSEMMVILGAWQSTTIWSKLPAILAIWGLVVTGVYLLRAVKDAWFGDLPARWRHLKDARTFGERAPFVILVGVLLVFGFWPQPMLDVIRQGTTPLLERLGVSASGARVEQASAPAELPPGLRPEGPGAGERGVGGAR
jgi:NADH-quinone oxidoreductase subunit M